MNDLWQKLERWALGETVSDLPSGVQTTIEHTWPFPPWVMLLLAIAAAAIVIGVYLRERGTLGHFGRGLLTALRLAIVGLLLLMLYGWTVQRHRTDLPDLVVVLDDSESMGLADHYDDTPSRSEITRRLAALKLSEATRLNLAKTLLLRSDANLLTELAERYNLKFYLVGSSARLQDDALDELRTSLTALQPTQASSRLGKGLRDVLEAQRGRPTAAVIVLSDGITTEGKPLSDAAEYARRKAIPLFMIGLGNDRAPRDLAVGDLLVDEMVFVNDLVNFDFKLTSEGFDGTATVRLKRKGDSAVLAEQRVTLPKAGGSQALRLSHRPAEKGEFEYVIEVSPRDGEMNRQNNTLSRRVMVSEATLRVLLVQAYPNYEFRFLKTMLERELNKNGGAGGERGFRSVLQEADLDYVATDKSAERVFPVSREELFKYDVLILGDINPAFLSPSLLNNIYEFVTVRGGGVVFIAGPKYMPLDFRGTPLEPLLPLDIDTAHVPDPDSIVKESFRPRLTPLGQSSPQLQLADDPADNVRLWREQLAPLRWFLSAPDLRPGVRVLAEHPTANGPTGEPLPIITLQFIGAGKVVFHATDETHRWRFRVGDQYFARYWIQTIRYLSRSKLLGQSRAAELTTDREEYRRGDPVRLRVRFFDDRLAPPQDDGVTVVLEQEGSQRKNLVLKRDAVSRGVFEGTVSNLREGKYRAWLASPALEGQPPAQNFTITSPPGELARTQMDLPELKLAAKTSAGRFYTWSDAERLLAELPRGRQVRIESLPPTPLWNSPLLAGLFVTLIGAEWLLRKRYGLL